ncbi:hypothetical protein [Rhodobacteraceae bacterium DSL-40]|uniref:hypothetical protein n=1 Tax=Amaricoccus sp. B4 TaxID=3368557 RepID=UPI000DABFAC1
MTTRGILAAGAAALLLAACAKEDDTAADSEAAVVGGASDLTPFEGARAGQAEMGIQSLGFRHIRSDGLTAYWLNPATGACAAIVTTEGRYSSVTMLPAGDC